jgi:subtilisin family serine protease
VGLRGWPGECGGRHGGGGGGEPCPPEMTARPTPPPAPIGAPAGRLVLSTWSQRACGRYGIQCVPWGPYAFMSGTSMAAPLVSALTARCYAKGVCRAENNTEMARIVANAVNYNAANRLYGFTGDPWRPVRGRYFGYLVWGNQW